MMLPWEKAPAAQARFSAGRHMVALLLDRGLTGSRAYWIEGLLDRGETTGVGRADALRAENAGSSRSTPAVIGTSRDLAPVKNGGEEWDVVGWAITKDLHATPFLNSLSQAALRRCAFFKSAHAGRHATTHAQCAITTASCADTPQAAGSRRPQSPTRSKGRMFEVARQQMRRFRRDCRLQDRLILCRKMRPLRQRVERHRRG